ESRTRKEQSFIVPVSEIIANDYDLSINKYKEVEKVKVEYEKPEVVLGRIEALQGEINAAFKEFREKYC
ncbi:MAG: SAM-dependent DNA methyltransferase, partial [Paludibacteraceae bacterium]|nr:SAM-dependent DNA methyltransferase [Paludibacteraceae bacterium]